MQTFPWRRFIVYDAIAGILWATYAAPLGYFGGKTFEDHPFWGLALALGIALTAGFSSSSSGTCWGVAARPSTTTGSGSA